MQQWDRRKIQHKWAYFYAQRRRPTGNFTEFVVRTYYIIQGACRSRGADRCPAAAVASHRIKRAVYQGIYDQPDHEAAAVIDDCKKHLVQMGYLRWEDGGKTICLGRPLDFLLPGEAETYEQKYGGLPQKEAQAQPAAGLPCPSCGSPMVLRQGRYGLFFGCSTFPRCRGTLSVAEGTYRMLQTEGLALYQAERPCWKCGEPLRVYSYFPLLDLRAQAPGLGERLEPLRAIRLSALPTLDRFLQGRYSTLGQRYSRKAGFSYLANLCPRCQALQGSQMTLGPVYEQLRRLAEQGKLAGQIQERIPVGEETLPLAEWTEVVEYAMEGADE